MTVCAHCGEETGTWIRGVWDDGKNIKLCHTGYIGRPDCYRRVTVYHEPLGILKGVTPAPDGINDIRDEVMIYLGYAENNPQTCPPADQSP